MVNFNGWNEGGWGEGRETGEMGVQLKVVLFGEMGKNIYPNLFQPCFENIDREP